MFAILRHVRLTCFLYETLRGFVYLAAGQSIHIYFIFQSLFFSAEEWDSGIWSFDVRIEASGGYSDCGYSDCKTLIIWKSRFSYFFAPISSYLKSYELHKVILSPLVICSCLRQELFRLFFKCALQFEKVKKNFKPTGILSLLSGSFSAYRNMAKGSCCTSVIANYLHMILWHGPK